MHAGARHPAQRAAGAAGQPSPAQLSRFKLAAPAPWLAVQGTWPTGIQAPLMDEGDFECLDYVYVWTAPDYTSK